MLCKSVQNVGKCYTKTQTYNNNFTKINSFKTKQKRLLDITFCAYPVYLLDGDKHAEDITIFAKAHDDQMDIQLIDVQTNPHQPSLKQMNSALMQLKNVRKLPKGSHVAFLCAMFVPILNINDRMNSVNYGTSHYLTSNNIKSSKDDVLKLLKTLRDNPERYQEDIKQMDPLRQGVEYVYDVIQELNKLTDEGYKIYIPASHPNYQSIKHLKEKYNIGNEFYHYMATGEDSGRKVDDMLQYIQDNNWNEINLLEFSNAHVVNMVKKDGSSFVYSSRNNCTTDTGIGVYNFTPIRKNNQIIGFSYSDDKTPEVKLEQFSDYDSVKVLSYFVGKDLSDVLATEEETKKYVNGDNSYSGKKLFKIQDIFSPFEISSKKLELLGSYTDGKNIYDTNSDGKVIFQKFNCEGSEKPSVYAMWGNCYAVIDAIKQDAQKNGLRTGATQPQSIISEDEVPFSNFNIKISPVTSSFSNVIEELHQADKQESLGNFYSAGKMYSNVAISMLNNNISSIQKIKENFDKREEYIRQLNEYYDYSEKYEKMGPFKKLISKYPTIPIPSYDEESAKQWSVIQDCINILNYAGNLHTKTKNYIPDGRICYSAAVRILKGNSESDKLLSAIKKGENWEEML